MLNGRCGRKSIRIGETLRRGLLVHSRQASCPPAKKSPLRKADPFSTLIREALDEV